MKTRLVKRTTISEKVFADASKFFKFHANGCGFHGYCTLDQLEGTIGTLNLVDACQRALMSKTDTYSRKFRCGLRIDFYSI